MPEKSKDTPDDEEKSANSAKVVRNTSTKASDKGNFKRKDNKEDHVLQEAIDVPDEMLDALTACPRADDALLYTCMCTVQRYE